MPGQLTIEGRAFKITLPDGQYVIAQVNIGDTWDTTIHRFEPGDEPVDEPDEEVEP